MSNFKVEFTLKQHTPIIHFQSDQSGATLRASELKPKFDKFLKKYAFNDKIPKEYKISDANDALDYTVKIAASKLYDTYQYKTYISKRDRENPQIKMGSYFGDNKAIQTDKITITIMSINNIKIIEYIKKYFIDFIIIENFGSRQNKGFGSFTVIKIDNKELNYNVEDILLNYYQIIYTMTHKNPLQKIQQDYQLLKSGSSNPQYKKSLLFNYMCNNKIRWEKRMIKEYMKKDYPSVFKTLKYEKQPTKCNNEENFQYEYVRGLLGITEQIEFLKLNARNFKDKIKINIKSVDNNIKRFKSPITFKVIGNNIYVLASNHIPVKGKEFTFLIKGEHGILNKSIKIPENFDIFKFLNNALPQLKYKILKAQK